MSTPDDTTIERAKRAGWSAEHVSDAAPPDTVMHYWVLIRPDGEYAEGDDYGLGWGDDSEAEAWARLPADWEGGA